MKKSRQDQQYLTHEGDDFFRRNFAGRDLPVLRPNKTTILDEINASGIRYSRVLEYGCNYGDLLAYFRCEGLAEECRGVEASGAAVEFGRARYGEKVTFVQGTIADNDINTDDSLVGRFDLVIVDDVFSWVSRETLLHSAANIDNVLADGGHLFIRDFYPDKRVKNLNHHVADGSVYNYKVPGSHAGLFMATGMYEIRRQMIYYDDKGMSTDYKCDNPFNYRWTDTILQKSVRDYFSESKKLD